MKPVIHGSFGTQLRALRETAGFTQEELATIAGLSVHAVSALERGERRRPHVETVRALCAALDLTGPARDAFVGSARAPASEPAADELSGSYVPVPLTPLRGREADLQSLRRWLDDPGARLITLTGPGGSGKTRLALELAREISEKGTLRVVFVPLAAIRTPAFVASAIAEALGLSDVMSAGLPVHARVVCEGRPTLLVLDNLEQVLDAAPLIADLLSTVPTLRLLATSRAPLRVRGEREYGVGPLSLGTDATALPTADLARLPAVRLFVERVRDMQPDFRLTPANGATVAAICRRLDALPLALELAAPWIKVLTPENLLERLKHDVLLSTIGPRDSPERQQTMNATVAWSYQLLEPDERRAFRRFAALPGPFPIDAATAVLAGRDAAAAEEPDALRVTAALIDKSLLLRMANSVVATCPLYEMLETVRAYAALELAAAGERDDAVEGLVRYCTGEAVLAREGLVGPAQIQWLDRVREDLESYRCALTWLLEHRRADEAAEIAWSLKYFWLIRGHAAEGLRWSEEILHLPALEPPAELKALAAATVLWYTQGELARARAGLDRIMVLARDTDRIDVVAHAEHLFGHVEHAAGNVRAARERFASSLAAFRTLGFPAGIGTALSGMAVLDLAAGETSDAERRLDEATRELRRAGPWFLTWALYARAILAVRRGNADAAIGLVRESLTRIRELHDKFAFVYALVPLAAAAVLKGDDAWAARILGARDAVTDRTGVTVVDTSVQDLRERAEREVRARLGPARWAKSYAAGRRTSIDALLDDIGAAAGG
ncbi:MAG TPA: helix-turn-helix domain-containing protein [Vicinamibacterales bacterium]|nr:helix-turn-helix domain-containing protein [Vicinamibacterales bacterium]